MKMLRFLDMLETRTNKILEVFCFVLFVIMIIIVWTQIFYRYVLGDGIIWAEEVSKYMMVWIAMLGAAIVYQEGGHISIRFFIDKFGNARWIAIFHIALAALLYVFLIIYGFDYAAFGRRFISSASGIRRFWPYLAIPVGGIFLLYYSIMRFLKVISGRPEFPTAHDIPETEASTSER